jgi:hypothetical protein
MPADRSTEELTIRPLAPDTWRAFADLVERHNGVFGGCWCTWFHSLSRDKDRTYESNRDLKCQLVEHGRAHAALLLSTRLPPMPVDCLHQEGVPSRSFAPIGVGRRESRHLAASRR